MIGEIIKILFWTVIAYLFVALLFGWWPFVGIPF